MILFAVLSIFVVRAHATPVRNERIRSGKFMRFGTPDDFFSDVLDEIHDPLSAAEEMSMENISDGLKNSAHQNNPAVYQIMKKNNMGRDPSKVEGDSALYSQNKGKYKLVTSTSGHIMLPPRPATESGIIIYGGQHYQYRKPGLDDHGNENRTGEIKVFWTSVTDAIQNLPFIPVQVNVPDMLNAMTNFLTSSIPIINRFTNPNNPRLPMRPSVHHITESLHEPYATYHSGANRFDDNTVEDREFKVEDKQAEKKSNKQRKGQKRKNSNKKTTNGKGEDKRLPSRQFFKRTTENPVGDKKVWHVFGSSEPGNVVKNIPITRRRFVVRDKEVFSFKNSDISNSPIMILNLPERPMMYYKSNINQKLGNEQKETSRIIPINKVNSSQSPRPVTYKSNKSKNDDKSSLRTKSQKDKNSASEKSKIK